MFHNVCPTAGNVVNQKDVKMHKEVLSVCMCVGGRARFSTPNSSAEIFLKNLLLFFKCTHFVGQCTFMSLEDELVTINKG